MDSKLTLETQESGVTPQVYKLHHALIASIKDDEMERSDLRAFAHEARIRGKEHAASCHRQALSYESQIQSVRILKEWKEARESMLGDLEAHVKATGEILAKLKTENGTPPVIESTKPGASREVKAEPRLKKRKSEQLFDQIEDLAATVKKLKGEGGSS
jgi:hypothetical protein